MTFLSRSAATPLPLCLEAIAPSAVRAQYATPPQFSSSANSRGRDPGGPTHEKAEDADITAAKPPSHHIA